MSEPKFYTFEEWLAVADLSDEDRYEECETCNGEGTHECDCGDEHACRQCNGAGKLDIAKQEYNLLKRENEKKWKEWQSAAGVF